VHEALQHKPREHAPCAHKEEEGGNVLGDDNHFCNTERDAAAAHTARGSPPSVACAKKEVVFNTPTCVIPDKRQQWLLPLCTPPPPPPRIADVWRLYKPVCVYISRACATLAPPLWTRRAHLPLHHTHTYTQPCPTPRYRCKPCAQSSAVNTPRIQTRAPLGGYWSMQYCAPTRWRRAYVAYNTRSKTAPTTHAVHANPEAPQMCRVTCCMSRSPSPSGELAAI